MNRTAAGFLGAALVLATPAIADDVRVALIEIEGAVADAPGPFDWLAPDQTTTLPGLIETLREVADDRPDALVIRLKDASLGMTQIEELGAVIAEVRAGGLPVHVFNETYSNPGLLLGSYADDVMVQDGGAVSLSGMYMEEMFLADTLDWIGMKADLVQVGAYKGANEQMTRSEPSPEWDRNIGQLLDSLYSNLRQKLKANRGMSDAQIDAAMERIWYSDAHEAVDAKLVDTVIDLPALGETLAARAGADDVVYETDYGPRGSSIDMADPFAVFRMLSSEPEHRPTGPTIAVVHIDGPIVDGDSTPAGLFGGSGNVGSRTIRNALEDILEEDDIRGVVVRINSPGGSAIASEIIWQGLRRVAEQKPVWVSVGSMAASGGYYIAVGGDRIYVNPSSVVGSIGVVGGKISMGGLYEKAHINVTPRSRGPRADMWDSSKPWSAEERELVRATMQETYDQFTSRVVAGREGIDLSKTAEGRLFTGSKAISLKMADEVGGLDVAIADLADDLGLSRYDVMDYPGPKGLSEMFEDMFGGMASAPGMRGELAGPIDAAAIRAARALLGERAWGQAADGLESMLRLREEPVQMFMPRILIFRD